MLLWILLLFANIYGFIINIQNGSAFWAAVCAIGVVLCLKSLIPSKQE